MHKLINKIKNLLFGSWFVKDTLEDRIFHIVLDLSLFIATIALALAAVQRQPVGSVIAIGVLLVFLIVIQYVAIRKPQHTKVCKIVMMFGMSLVLFPLRFFACGGIYSGMILFYLIGLGLFAVLFKGKLSLIAFICSLVLMEVTTTVSVYFPQFTQPMTQQDHLADLDSSFLLAAIALFSLITLILRTYREERKQREDLMAELHSLSVIDTLTGLYNRRELFRRLETLYSEGADTETPARLGHYILMVDVDDFKAVNDTYGHSFGDTVLASVAGELRSLARPEHEELAARYGGEEFVSILTAGSMEEAFRRAEDARHRIAALNWEANPEVRVTVSGGLIACEAHPDLTRAMHDVDELLYRAKSAGKNRICRETE